MAYLQDINISLIKATLAAPSVGFGLPLITGDTGMFKSADILTGEAGLTWRAKTRGSAFYVNVIYADPGIADQTIAVGTTGTGTDIDPYIITIDLATDSGSVITTRAKDIKAAIEADVTANALVALAFIGQFGTGVVTAVASTSLTSTRYVKVSNASDLLKYYDSADTEYKMAVKMQAETIHVEEIAVYDRNGLAGSLTSILNTLILTENSWYGLLVTETDKTTLQEAGDWAFDNKKLFLGCTSDETVLTGRSNNREAYLIHDTPSNYPHAQLMGTMFARDPGSATWKWKKLSNQAATAVNSVALNFIRDNQGNALTSQGGQTFTNEGTTTELNFYIDDRRGMDWIQATMEIDLLNLFLNNDKITYDAIGLAQIESVIANRLQIAGRRGLIAVASTADEIAASYDKQFQFSVAVPARSLQDPLDVAARKVAGVEFKYIFAGAVHEIDVRGFAAL